MLALLRELNSTGTTVLVVTHDREIAGSLHRQVQMFDGQIAADSAAAVA